MSDNLVLESLSAIRAKQDEHGETLREIKQRLGFLEEGYASLSRRVDRMNFRLDRIEGRLELADAPPGA